MADTKISALPSSSTPLAGTEVLPIVQSSTTKQVSVANLTAGRDVSAQTATTQQSVAGGVDLYTLENTNSTAVTTKYAGIRYRGRDTVNSGKDAAYIRAYPNDQDYVNTYLSIWTRGSDALSEKIQIRSGGDVYLSLGNLIPALAGKGVNFTANTPAAGMTSQLLNWYEEGTWTGTLTAATPPTTPVTATGRYTRIGRQVTVNIEFDNKNTTGASGAMSVTGLPFTAGSLGYGPTMKNSMGTNVITAAVYSGNTKVDFSDAADMTTFNIVAAAGIYLRFSVTYFV